MKPNNLKIKYLPLRQKQQGAILLVSLMILLVLTLIGVSSLNGSLMEEKMAANAQTSTTVFQGAESAIKTAYYVEKQKPALAVTRANSRATVPNYRAGGTTRHARLEAPAEKVKTRFFNSSTGIFVARGIEIIGTAEMRGITESNAQGYNIYPLRP